MFVASCRFSSPLKPETARRIGPVLIASVFTALLSGCGATLPEGQLTPIETSSSSNAQKVGRVETASLRTSPDEKFAVTKAADVMTSASVAGASGYKIGPQDVLDISVFKVPELSKSLQVADSGNINLPLVGEMPAAGRTPEELEADLTRQLGRKYLQSPQVTVYVKEYNSQRITVEGAVKKPGVYPFRGKGSLLQYLAMAEGLDSLSSDSTVLVFRQISGKRAAAKFDISQIRAGKEDDPAVQSGDVIVAGTSATKETFNTIMKVLPLAAVFTFL
ncbi:polysaccharide export outer membrane protein [Hyphomicrobium facile]|uniref:Polysaccharide export outer membrane protein n=2 Tax=Hyphomicrobium facile TaxID=51670 RepID=A0A1I7NDI9_9HYPH|nr:polysaccharide export outer membrane protein [Hyphomicrobium facile]